MAYTRPTRRHYDLQKEMHDACFGLNQAVKALNAITGENSILNCVLRTTSRLSASCLNNWQSVSVTSTVGLAAWVSRGSRKKSARQ